MAQTSVDLSGAKERAAATRKLAGELEPRVVQRALVTLARRLGPEVSRQLGAILNLPKSKISSRVKIDKGDTFIEVTLSGRRIALGQFGGKYGGHNTAGATAQVFIGQASKVYGSAFIISGKRGTILARKLIAANKRTARLPLQPLFGPDVGSVFVSPKHQALTNLNDFAFTTLGDELERLTVIEMESVG